MPGEWAQMVNDAQKYRDHHPAKLTNCCVFTCGTQASRGGFILEDSQPVSDTQTPPCSPFTSSVVGWSTLHLVFEGEIVFLTLLRIKNLSCRGHNSRVLVGKFASSHSISVRFSFFFSCRMRSKVRKASECCPCLPNDKLFLVF